MWRRAIVLLLASSSSATAAEPPRARPPEFSDEDRSAFFDDAFATLVGDRPTPSTEPTERRNNGPAMASSATPAWSEMIAADVLETEIKRQAAVLAQLTRSAPAYKAGGFRDASDALSVVATMFAVTAEHTGHPRWRDDAAALRDLFANGAAAADTATDAAFQAAAARSAELADLVRGGRPATPEPAAEVDWATLASRTALMRRMDAADEQRLRGWTATERAFRRKVDDARHEAQVLAALAEVIVRPESYDYDDPDYQAFARRLRDAAARVAAAAEAEDHPAAAEAMTEVSRSCVDCHADYRG